MVKLFRVTILSSMLLVSAVSFGRGFGSSFGGSLLGSFAGTSISNAMTRPRNECVYQQPTVRTHTVQTRYIERPSYVVESPATYVDIRQEKRTLAPKSTFTINDEIRLQELTLENQKAEIEKLKAQNEKLRLENEKSKLELERLQLQKV